MADTDVLPDPVQTDPAAEPASAEPAEVVAPVAEAAPAEPTDPDDIGAVRKLFWGDEEVSEEALQNAAALTPEQIAALDSTTRGFVKGLVGRAERLITKARTEIDADRKAIADEHAKLEAEAREIAKQRSAFRASVANPETIKRLQAQVAARPAKVDITDPESLLKELSARQAEADLAARQPSIEAADRDARIMARDSAMVAAGLDPSKDLDELNKRLLEEYGDVKTLAVMSQAAVAAGRPEAAPIHVMSKRIAAERATAKVRDDRAAEAADRGRAAATMATTTRPGAGAAPSPQDVIKTVESAPDFDFTTAYRSNAAYKRAIDHFNATA